MSTVSSFMRLFRGDLPTSATALASGSERIARRSSGFAEFARVLGTNGACVLDLGPTSAANITHFTNLGGRYYNEDVLLAGAAPEYVRTTDDGTRSIDVEHFMAENLLYEEGIFDGVLLWDMPDYLPESLVKPLVERLCKSMRPGGTLLGFFHTKDAGPEAPYFRYHVSPNPESVVLQPVWKVQEGRGLKQPLFRLQRVFANRHIENLFKDFASLKFFLARDNVREVLAKR
jgi:SAM-dependent methyltransferase